MARYGSDCNHMERVLQLLADELRSIDSDDELQVAKRAEEVREIEKRCKPHADEACRSGGCFNRGVHRYTAHANRGLIEQSLDSIFFCDECWFVIGADGKCFADEFKYCHECGFDMQSSLGDDVPTCTLIGGLGKEDLEIYHNACGELCPVCCRFYVNKQKVRAEVPSLIGSQPVCKSCLGGSPACDFVRNNPAIIRPVAPGSPFVRLIRASERGPRHRGTAGYARAEQKKADKARLANEQPKNRKGEVLLKSRKLRKSEIDGN